MKEYIGGDIGVMVQQGNPLLESITGVADGKSWRWTKAEVHRLHDHIDVPSQT